MKPRKIFGLLIFVFQVILLLKLVELAQSSTTPASSHDPSKDVQTASTTSSLLRRTSALVPVSPAVPRNDSPFGFLYDLYRGLVKNDKRSSVLVEGNRTEVYIPVIQLAVCVVIAVGWYFIFIRIWKYPLVGDFNKPAETTTAVPPKPPGMGSMPVDENMWDDGGDSYQTYGQSDSNDTPDKSAYSNLMYGEKKYGKV